MEGHIRTVASLHIALSILSFMIAVILYSLLNVIGNFIDEQEAKIVLSIVANAPRYISYYSFNPRIYCRTGIIKIQRVGTHPDTDHFGIKTFKFPDRNCCWCLFYLGIGTKRINRPVR